MTSSNDSGRPSSTGTSALGAWRSAALLCAACLVISAPPAQAGINVWTSHGPPGGRVQALAIDPATPTTLYAGTGFCDDQGCHDGGGVFKSTDGGNTWNAVNTGLTNTLVNGLAIDPITPSTLYAGTEVACQADGCVGGVFKSTDGAHTWGAVNTGLISRGVTTLAIDPITPSTLYAGISADGVFKSTDGAHTWGAANRGLTSTHINALAIDPSTPGTLYAGISGAGVFKSIDGAHTWSLVNTGPIDTGVLTLAIDPTSPGTLYAGTGGGVFKSTDGGGTWNVTGMTSGEFNALAIDPTTPTTLYAGTAYEGVFKSTDGGGAWSALNTGLPNLDILTLAIDPITPSRLYAGTAGGGVFVIEQVSACVGDCTGDEQVSIDELLTMVNIALGTTAIAECTMGDANVNGEITVAEIIAAVNNALSGCGRGGCTPDCTGKICGEDDSCGGYCSACPEGQSCHGLGQGHACGPDKSLAIKSDSSWRASLVEVPGWETIGFDDSRWAAAVSPAPESCGVEFTPQWIGRPYKYWEHQGVRPMWSAEQQRFVYLRKSFSLASAEDVTSARLSVWVDDDHILYVNGTQLYVEQDNQAGPVVETDLAPYLRTGKNVIAIIGDDSQGGCRWVIANGTITWAGCTPACSGKSCGDPDGCGGKCTACSSGQACNAATWQCQSG